MYIAKRRRYTWGPFVAVCCSVSDTETYMYLRSVYHGLFVAYTAAHGDRRTSGTCRSLCHAHCSTLWSKCTWGPSVAARYSVRDKETYMYLRSVCRSVLQCMWQTDLHIPEVRLSHGRRTEDMHHLRLLLHLFVSCCSVLQCVAVCCSVFQCVAVWCSVCYSVLQRVLQCVAAYVAACCSVLQRFAAYCSVLQYVTTGGGQDVLGYLATHTLLCCLQTVGSIKL